MTARWLIPTAHAVLPVGAVIAAHPAFGDVRQSDGERALKAKYSPLTKDSLLAALGDSDKDVRVLAAIRLADAGEKSAVPFILRLASQEPQPFVRQGLILQAARLGFEPAVATLRDECKSGSSQVLQMSAAQAMVAFLHNEDCLDDVLRVLRSGDDGQADHVDAVWTAFCVLPRFQHPPASELAEIRDVGALYLRSDKSQYRSQAADILQRFGDDASAQDLSAALSIETDPTARTAMDRSLHLLEERLAKSR